MITGAILLLVAGLSFLLAARSDDVLGAWARLRHTFDVWSFLATQTPSSCEILEADELSLYLRLRIEGRRDAYWSKDVRRPGRAYRIHVAPDCIARLPFRCEWTQRRYLDSSAFCLRTDDASTDELVLVQRGRRWQVLLGDADQIRSEDNHIMHCHVAVHARVLPSLDDEDALDSLFDNLPNLHSRIREFVAGHLRNEIQNRKYRDAMYDVPAFVRSLNEAWRGRSDLSQFIAVLDVAFTGLLIKPRKEAELRYLERLRAKVSNLEARRMRVKTAVEATAGSFRDEHRAIERDMDENLRNLGETAPDSMEGLVKTMRANFKMLRSEEDLRKSVDGLYPTDDVERNVQSMLDGIARMNDYLDRIDNERRGLEEEGGEV